MIDMITPKTKIISDTHFFHDNIVKYEPKRKIDMQEKGFENHNEWLLDLWNSQIKEEDTVLCLGDFAAKQISELIPKLNGKKILILGNHDRKGINTYKGFEWVVKSLWIQYNDDVLKIENIKDELFSGIIMDINEKPILFSHYPVFNNDKYDIQNERIMFRQRKFEDFYDSFGCELNIHGHTHSKNSDFKDSFNASIESTNFKVKTIEEIINDFFQNK